MTDVYDQDHWLIKKLRANELTLAEANYAAGIITGLDTKKKEYEAKMRQATETTKEMLIQLREMEKFVIELKQKEKEEKYGTPWTI